ncbi:hypothetical protein ASPWEDRAFT_430953 [Aspergillus wentii DTO 134E9]|uniref:CENP-V/GFA domain-containing protein n=1 Tax=Aspergillus wentii DTO 134E9 TaxID=1073089 RepID=A0A1L9RPG1_ASPWE|nr:uncharacterized protein ASPWEDRAFT_430953 [Aspergillus wentii DTO 134E9]KAI9924119.1 hypothetical protein MW887_007359 [Aspergillus wentii]OJJ36835.1 hypothetical protein ASPWEDRAFT_430953 [Aspergillus wentii DTO 134E9]
MTGSISCLCGRAAQDIVLEPSTDHSIIHLCHCDSCRAITGLLCSSYRLLHTRPQKLESLGEYNQSEGICRYFCRTCGAHVFVHLEHSDQFLVASGLLVTKPPQLLSIQHWQIGDTHDGGLSSFLPGESVATRPGYCRLHAEIRAQSPAEAIPEYLESPDTASDSEHYRILQAQCYCGGVEFHITPPDSSSKDAYSPWPDLLVPYHSTSSVNTEDVKWWLQTGNTKYLAGTCACDSCRLASGFPIQTWAFVPRSNISNIDRSLTMQQYESSPGVYREFCSRCGATVFWHCQERPRIIDVSVGLLHAKSGARAEEWLEWATGRVSFAEMALEKKLIQMLEKGLRNWKQEKGPQTIGSKYPGAL